MAKKDILMTFVVKATDILSVDNIYDEATGLHILGIKKTDGTFVEMELDACTLTSAAITIAKKAPPHGS